MSIFSMELTYNQKGWFCVCGAFLIQFSLGTMYTFGNMSPYMSSYLKLRTSNTWVTTGDTVWILAGNFILLGGLMAIGGLIEKKLGNRMTCFIGSLIVSLSVGLTYFTIKQNLWLVILTYGAGYGLGIAIAYSVALTSAIKWFPEKRGMISGIVVGGFGLGAFIFSFIQTGYINPLNIPPRLFNESVLIESSMNNSNKVKYFFDDSILDKVPISFLIMGSAYLVIQVVGVILLMDFNSSNNRLSQHLKHSGTDVSCHESDKVLLNKSPENEIDHAITDKTISEKVDYTLSLAIKEKVFWILWGTFFLNGMVIVTISAVFKSFGQQFISNDQYFSTLGAVGGICNCLGRVIWGRLYDRFKYRKVMSALTILMAVTMGTFYFLSYITHPVVVKILYFIWGCLLFIGLSGSFAILPSGTGQCFGNTNLATIYGVIFTGLALSSILGAFVSSFLFATLQYRGQFIIASIAAIISLILTQFFALPKDRKDSKDERLVKDTEA